MSTIGEDGGDSLSAPLLSGAVGGGGAPGTSAATGGKMVLVDGAPMGAAAAGVASKARSRDPLEAISPSGASLRRHTSASSKSSTRREESTSWKYSSLGAALLSEVSRDVPTTGACRSS